MNVYFGRQLGDISWSEAAFLAGMLQAPYGHDPATAGDEQAAKRWSYAADKLVERGYVSPQVRATMAYPGTEILAPGAARAGKISYSDYHVEQQVLAELEASGVSLERLRREGATVRTTIDRQTQAAAEQAVHDRLAREPDYLRAAVVSIDPRTGDVLAYEGGEWSVRDYAVTAHRSGSAFRPFVTLAQLEHGPDAAPVHIRQAAYDAGIPQFVDGVRTLTQPDDVHIATTIADGVYRLRPLDMAAAYATFASGGTRIAPHFIAEVREGVPAFDDPTGKITATLQAMFGLGGVPGQFPLPGTDDNSDAWMIGSSSRATTAVWVGSDDERPLRDTNGAKITGDTMPAQIWRAVASAGGIQLFAAPGKAVTP
jgi:membrane peptidoglycan carboxypeptidase